MPTSCDFARPIHGRNKRDFSSSLAHSKNVGQESKYLKEEFIEKRYGMAENNTDREQERYTAISRNKKSFREIKKSRIEKKSALEREIES